MSVPFPQYIFESVLAEQVQASLRLMFQRWGRPHAIRVDNGIPWGNQNGLPPPLTLWLVGLGIQVIHNRAYCPQHNSKVERTHGVMKAWVEPEQCSDWEDLVTRLDWATQVQREVYQNRCGQTRMQAHPNLRMGGRGYEATLEAQHWDLRTVARFMAQYRCTRKVSQSGQISLYSQNYSVGRAYASQLVSVQFDPEGLEWVIEDVHGVCIHRCHVQGFNAPSIRSMQFSYRRPNRCPKKGG